MSPNLYGTYFMERSVAASHANTIAIGGDKSHRHSTARRTSHQRAGKGWMEGRNTHRSHAVRNAHQALPVKQFPGAIPLAGHKNRTEGCLLPR